MREKQRNYICATLLLLAVATMYDAAEARVQSPPTTFAYFDSEIVRADITRRIDEAKQAHEGIYQFEQHALSQLENGEELSDQTVADLDHLIENERKDLYRLAPPLVAGTLWTLDKDIASTMEHHSGKQHLTEKEREVLTTQLKAKLEAARTINWLSSEEANDEIRSAVQEIAEHNGLRVIIARSALLYADIPHFPDVHGDITALLRMSVRRGGNAPALGDPKQTISLEKLGYCDASFARMFLRENGLIAPNPTLQQLIKELAVEQSLSIVVDTSGIWRGAEPLLYHSQDLTPVILQRLKTRFHAAAKWTDNR